MTEAHAQRTHAQLAPSAAHRWVACPGSIAMCEGIEERSSSYANEGTAAHEVSAHCLKNGVEPSALLGTIVDIEAKSPGEMFANRGEPDGMTRFEVDEEMVEAVQLYINTVNSLIPKKGEYELDIEQRLDMRHIHPEIYGTGDAVVYQVDARRLHVIDLKYGKGVAVEPGENPQLMLYGAGAARRYHNRALEEVALHIVQPRAPHVRGPVRSWATDPITLMEFEDDLKEAALQTEEASLVYNTPAFEKYLHPGEHCRFCRASPICPALRQQSLTDAMAEFADGEVTLPGSPSRLAPDDFGRVLLAAERIGNWIKAVQEYAHAEAVAGRTPAGFKLVAKRAVRKWKGEDQAYDAMLMAGVGDIYVEPKLKSPAQVEKEIGKKAFTTIEEYVTKVSSGTNLVPISDPRPTVKPDAASEFAE